MGTYSDADLQDIKDLAKENNKILRNLQKRARIATVFYSIKWVAIIIIALGIYNYIQPVLNQFFATYNSLVDSAAAIGEIKDGLPNGSNFRNLFGN